ncbi:TRAP transporter large permease subunit, partial [Oceanicola sp. S124]|uniref:TRAP transporter large permease subunit n=1 Tax=Oceanicola sp. S124 TaxID=1042378 RepID=UPI0002559681
MMPSAPARICGALAAVSGATAVLLPFLYALDPFRISSAWIVDEQFLAAMLGAALVFGFARRAQRAAGRTARLAFLLLAVLAAGAAAAITRHYGSESMLFVQATPLLIAVSGTLLALCLVATRFHGGWQMLLMVLGFFIFGYVAQFLDGMFAAAQVQFDRYLVYMTFGGDGLLGRAIDIISRTVTIFVVFGIAYEISGGSDTIAALALKAARIGRGSAIKVTVLASGLFGTISGSATSNVLTSGAFSIPGMRRVGVPPATAGGIEAVASTCGQ